MPNVKPRPVKVCPTCEEEFLAARPEQKFCSRKCIQGKGQAHNICPCGTSTGCYSRKYCSPEHRALYSKKKAPARMVTKVCLGCGEEFERPHYYPGKMKYCSNKCSHSQRKKVRDKFIADLPEGAIIFHSGWEIRFWAACLRFDIPIRSYDGPDMETSEGIYRPDFIINDSDVIEVKGWLRPESEAKLEESGVLVIRQDELFEFEKTGCLPTGAAL